MATRKQTTLKQNEIYGMEFNSGYKRYFVFGTDPHEMFKRIVWMYNSYAGTKYNSYTFKKICPKEDYYFFLYKFDVRETFSFDDDCYSMGELGGTKIGEYLDLAGRKVL